VALVSRRLWFHLNACVFKNWQPVADDVVRSVLDQVLQWCLAGLVDRLCLYIYIRYSPLRISVVRQLCCNSLSLIQCVSGMILKKIEVAVRPKTLVINGNVTLHISNPYH
jgi:hypothetical protein